MDVGVSLPRNGILTICQNGVIHHNDPPTTRLPISRGAQDQGHTCQLKAFRGYEHVGAAVSPLMNHIDT